MFFIFLPQFLFENSSKILFFIGSFPPERCSLSVGYISVYIGALWRVCVCIFLLVVISVVNSSGDTRTTLN